jgi:hypothetical protein
MEDAGKFYGHLVYFTAIWYILCPFWYILCPFGYILCHLVYFFRFGLLYQEKTGNPDDVVMFFRHVLVNVWQQDRPRNWNGSSVACQRSYIFHDLKKHVSLFLPAIEATALFSIYLFSRFN